ncbi:hypothetical protein S40293_10288 [Stachybotrys chartarum IBT 40293]|nr:hypothetical protein S40293_10288 [Stachybotrys chartarum IBT 40293]
MKSPPSIRDDTPDVWAALPLFNRMDSPDRIQDVLAWQPAAVNFEIPDVDDGFLHDYDMMNYEGLPISNLSDSTENQQELIISPFQPDATSFSTESCKFQPEFNIPGFPSEYGFESNILEQVHSPGQRSLSNQSFDEHMSQLMFTLPCRCTFQNCQSTTIFTTGRDFRRHYLQHIKRFFCRHKNCPQSTSDPEGANTKGFATHKDRARHEARHNPAIKCPGHNRNGRQCTRIFSRIDNMKDHYRRIHEKGCKT